MTFQASLISSDGARALGSLVEDLARQWTANRHARDDVNVVFDVIRTVVSISISRVATNWNSGHDALRVMPPEVQESCFGLLPVPDRCRLSLVCSLWKKSISNSPGVWNHLNLTHWKPQTDALLARSGQMPLDLTVVLGRDLASWESTLRPHSHRIRSLDLRHSTGKTHLAFDFPTPRLEELSIVTDASITSTLSPVLFAKDAPNLRSLRLTCSTVPLECPAFGCVATLTIEYGRGTLSHLFAVMPHLEILEITSVGFSVHLPPIPPRSSLRILRLVGVFMPVEELVRHGYSEIDVLDVTTTTSSTTQFTDAIARWPELATTVTVHSDWEFEIVLQPDQRRQLRFAVRPSHYTSFGKVFRRGGAICDNIQRLVLPSSFRQSPYAPPSRTLVVADKKVTLPALRTLIIKCGNIHLPHHAMYPLRECLPGKLAVPRLARIEVLMAVEAAPLEQDRVDVADLLALVETVLVCDDPGALEIFVDTASGIVLEGDVDKLRNYVGKLLV